MAEAACEPQPRLRSRMPPQFYEDMLKTLGLEEAPRNTTSGFLDGDGQGRWLSDEIRRDEDRWSE